MHKLRRYLLENVRVWFITTRSQKVYRERGRKYCSKKWKQKQFAVVVTGLSSNWIWSNIANLFYFNLNVFLSFIYMTTENSQEKSKSASDFFTFLNSTVSSYIITFHRFIFSSLIFENIQYLTILSEVVIATWWDIIRDWVDYIFLAMLLG